MNGDKVREGTSSELRFSSSWILKTQLPLSAIWSLVNERIKSRYKGVSIDIYRLDYTLVKFARNSFERGTFSRNHQMREVT